MRTVTVAVFNSQSEAEPLERCLAAAGIQAEIHSESKLEEELDFSRVSAGVRIEVPRADFEAALGIVYDWNVTWSAEKAALSQFESPSRGTVTRRTDSNPPSAA